MDVDHQTKETWITVVFVCFIKPKRGLNQDCPRTFFHRRKCKARGRQWLSLTCENLEPMLGNSWYGGPWKKCSLQNLSSLESLKRVSYWVLATQHVFFEIFSESESKEIWFLSSFWATNLDMAPFKTVKICYLHPTILSKIHRVRIVYMKLGRSKSIGPKDYPWRDWGRELGWQDAGTR